MRLRSGLNRGGTPSEPWSQVIVALAIIGGLLGGLGAASLGSAALSAGRWPIFIAGLIFMAAGIYVRQWSIFTLGRFFTAEVRVRADQPVIDTGPYRWVRPIKRRGLPRGRPAAQGLASCLQFYARAGDIGATGDVGRMSYRPAPTGEMLVLVVEDHATLADRIAQGLRRAGMAVDAVHDGAAALEAAAQTAYDVIVLDRDLSGVHGDRVC